MSLLSLAIFTLTASSGPTTSISENFDTLSPGSFTSYSGFGGQGSINAYGSGSILVDPTSLPPRSGSSAIFGNSAAVVISFNQTWNHMSAYFRVPRLDMIQAKSLLKFNMPTFAVTEFYRGGSQVGMSVYTIVKDDRYTHFDWDVTEDGGFDGMVILGNGGNGDLIGIDDMVASS